MRQVATDYNDLTHRDGLDGYTLPLGTEDIWPELATLRPGERIISTDGMELWSEGEAAVREAHGRRYWYAQRITSWHYLENEPLPPDTDPHRMASSVPGPAPAS